MLQAVIMAGGSGTRFWPLSRRANPKQFLNLYGDRSLIQQAYDRIVGVVGTNNVLVVTNHEMAEKTREQLPELNPEQIVGEPCGRDTAACIALAASLALRKGPDARTVVLAADHLIQPVEQFQAAVRTADAFVGQNPDALVTFGIRPTGPATGYGYLRRDRKEWSRKEEAGEISVFRLKSFHEKPDLDKAKQFVESGDYYWNSGIFCWRADTILREIERCSPELSQAVGSIAEAWTTAKQAEVFAKEYDRLKRISIDYAVMEKAVNVYMVEATFQWDDVGGWLALERVLPKDSEGNVVIGSHQGLDSNDCVVVGKSNHLIGTLGVRDLIIVHTPDVTLVANRKDEQSVKQLLSKLMDGGLEHYL